MMMMMMMTLEWTLYKVKIGTLLTRALGNVHTNFDFSTFLLSS